MQLIKDILLATDFMKSSQHLIDTAITLGQTFHSDITILHVLPRGIRGEKNLLMIKEVANSKMEHAVEAIESKGVTVKQTFLRQGNIAEVVIRTADRISANLILLGSSELSKQEAYKLGTTADKIIRKSEIPVWVVNKDNNINVERIICPVDFSDESKRALKDAAYIARSFNARLIIFSVSEMYDTNYPRFDPQSGGINKMAFTEHEKMLEEFMKAIKTVGLDYEVVIKTGDPSKEILKGIKEFNTDLLIMGTTGKSGLSRWLMGSVTEKVTREVPCSFITVKSANILTLELESRVMDLEYHFKAAQELLDKGLFEEAAEQFLVCLKINDMHIPSLVGISKAYENLGDSHLAENYKTIARSTLAKMWDEKIEHEVRKYYKL